MTALALVASAARGRCERGRHVRRAADKSRDCSIELNGAGVSGDGVVTVLPATITVSGDVPVGATVCSYSSRLRPMLLR
jgi:hypothetical protein